MNQIDIPNYQYFLGCNAKRTVRLTFLVKKFVFHTEICDYLKKLFLNYSIFDRVKEMSKSDQTWYGISHVYLEYKTKNNFCCSLSRKKDRISIGNINSFSYSILKIIEILSDEGVVQSEPNCYPRLQVLFRF